MKNELNHEEPPWITPVNKRIKETKVEKNKIKPCDDLDGGPDEMAEEIWTPKKKRWKHLELELIHHEQTSKEGITWRRWNKNKNYVMLILTKLNW